MAPKPGLHRLIASEIGKAECHEAALCVMRGGHILAASGGTWNGAPVTEDTPFLIASTSKLLLTALMFRMAATLFDGRDMAYSVGAVIHWVHDDIAPAFAPGTANRALYSDTNFYLPAELIARLRRQPAASAG